MSNGRILVVDDEPQIRRIMRTTLTGAGYEVEDAKTGEEATEKLRVYKPDLVLLDMNMPGMGGLEACRELRADANVAIIMLTVPVAVFGGHVSDSPRRSAAAGASLWPPEWEEG